LLKRRLARAMLACALSAGMQRDAGARPPATAPPDLALVEAARAGDAQGVRDALSRGANANGEDEGHRPALVWAVASRKADAVAALLDGGADPAEQDATVTPLTMATLIGNESLATLLLDRGAPINARDERHMTSLMLAAALGHMDVLDTLVRRPPLRGQQRADGGAAAARDRRRAPRPRGQAGPHRGPARATERLHGGGRGADCPGSAGDAAASAGTACGEAGPARREALTPARRRWAGGLLAAVLVLDPAPRRMEAAGEVPPKRSPSRPPTRRGPATAASPAPGGPRGFATEAESWADAARVAWSYVPTHTVAGTGLVNATSEYAYVTAWDIGSMLAAVHCAHVLGLVDDAAYKQRMEGLLATLGKLPLFEGIAFNKAYSVRGAMVSRGRAASRRGQGWSAIDLGRLLLWLRVVARDPQFTESAARVAQRLDQSRVVSNGYLRGGELGADGSVQEHQEGTIGYEQYAARGFDAWQMPVAKALDLRRHAVPIQLMGQNLLADDRSNDRLTSEPFVLLGLEVGWTEPEKALAEALLAAQQERWRRTGQVTIASEDAIAQPPSYFYYYCVFAQGRLFQTTAQDRVAALAGPRWVSAKGAFGWAALRPSDYTRMAVKSVGAARTARGWASGIHEGRARSTGAVNINTQAVILEAALFRQRGGRPLLERQ
jgi:uncharacterized protein DUF3131/ankyrin repeat protein